MDFVLTVLLLCMLGYFFPNTVFCFPDYTPLCALQWLDSYVTAYLFYSRFHHSCDSLYKAVLGDFFHPGRLSQDISEAAE